MDEATILAAGKERYPHHTRLDVAAEHGEFWLLCLCGEVWSVHETDRPDQPAFELVDCGDGSCEND